MNFRLSITRIVVRSKKRTQLRAADEWVATLEDQIASGRALLDVALRKRDQLRAELNLLETPDEIVRRAGAGA